MPPRPVRLLLRLGDPVTSGGANEVTASDEQQRRPGTSRTPAPAGHCTSRCSSPPRVVAVEVGNERLSGSDHRGAQTRRLHHKVVEKETPRWPKVRG